jgi:DNA-binding NarL/FixJ family response regulator
VIRIIVVDDHPALRAGLETVLKAEPGIVPVGSADSGLSLWPLLNTTRPDIVLLDYHLPGEDGLTLCRRLKSQALAPKVLLYSAYAGSALAIPALLAGADGVIPKSIPALELFEAIRQVAGGERVIPPVPRELLTDAHRRIEEEDLPILGMALDDTPHGEMAQVLGIDASDLARRIERMIHVLRVDVPEPAAG